MDASSYSRSQSLTSNHDNPKNPSVTPRYRTSAIADLLLVVRTAVAADS
jgi:hypothetical protein